MSYICGFYEDTLTHERTLDHSRSQGNKIIRSEIDSFQNAYFLISQPNPMMFHSLELSRRDDFNEGYIIEFG